jgi:tetratricopeptide (TPR) repeat protein
MKRLVVAVALLAACRDGKAPSARKDAGRDGPASRVSAVPKLPRSADGVAELKILDESIARASNDARTRVPLLLQRASIRGRLEDYEAAVRDSAPLVADPRADATALQLRVQALLRVHDFTGARAVLAKLAKLVHPSQLVDHEIALAEAAGDTDRALAMRAERAKESPSPMHLTLWAAALAQAGRTDEAIAIIPTAAAAVRDNPPQLIAWLLFQWGRIYELRGEHATAREFFAAAHARLPGYVEATTHLAQTMIATGDTTAAKQLVDTALTSDRHPELLALGAQLGSPALAEAARAEWERYVTALPLAFADHAARFYLGVGKNPARALELARLNQKNRDTRDARALVAEAALAAGDAPGACAVIDPLVSAGTRAQRFVAWQALSRCGRPGDADRLGRELGIIQ